MTPCIALAGAPGTGLQDLQAGLAARLAGSAPAARVFDLTPWLLREAAMPPPPDACCLLMGLDAVPPADRAAAEVVDARLRQALRAAALPYGVVYGRGEERIDAAWRLLRNRQPTVEPQPEAAGNPPATRLRPCCPECLVPECEHRLFRFAARG